MKLIEKYNEIGITLELEAFDYFISNLKNTIRSYDFYVDWEKVLFNISEIEISLNIMNSLIGKENIADKFKKLIELYPEVVSVIPILIAVREKTIEVIESGIDIEYSFRKKKKYSDEEINKIVYFSKKCGLLKIFEDKSVKNLVDYCIGVEVGLDTNARKNRSGTSMERIAETYIKDICTRHKYKYITQATSNKIKTEFIKEIPTDKVNRKFDFAIDTGEKIYLIEVNYYGGGGSKLKSVAGEFTTLFELIKQNPKVEFIWITDGKGWETAKAPLKEAFYATDYILNLKMIEDGFLEEILI